MEAIFSPGYNKKGKTLYEIKKHRQYEMIKRKKLSLYYPLYQGESTLHIFLSTYYPLTLLDIKTKWLFKILLYKWRLNTYTLVNDVDPITLQCPVKPLTFISHRKLKYTYDAISLFKDIHLTLLQHQAFIPSPQTPKNILTNEPFTYIQQISILNQIKAYGYTSWAIEGYISSGYSIDKFSTMFRVNLLAYSAKMTILDFDDYEGGDTIYNFILEMHIENNINLSSRHKNIFKWIIYHLNTDKFYINWRNKCIQWYENDIYNGDSNIRYIKTNEIIKECKKICVIPVNLIKAYIRSLNNKK